MYQASSRLRKRAAKVIIKEELEAMQKLVNHERIVLNTKTGNIEVYRLEDEDTQDWWMHKEDKENQKQRGNIVLWYINGARPITEIKALMKKNSTEPLPSAVSFGDDMWIEWYLSAYFENEINWEDDLPGRSATQAHRNYW